jgi:hypothetical protein
LRLSNTIRCCGYGRDADGHLEKAFIGREYTFIISMVIFFVGIRPSLLD